MARSASSASSVGTAARSARWARCFTIAAGAIVVALPLTGCTTTQHEAQRLQLDSARLRAALKRTRVTIANRVVVPTSVATLSAGARTAFVVTVRNMEHHGVTDLPISVGYRSADGVRTYVNASANVSYFQAHLPAIAAGHSLTWVYTVARHAVTRGERPFAIVGTKPSAPARLTETGVRIGLRAAYFTGAGSVTVHLNNPSSVPQYQLQVYAYAHQGRHLAAAGNLTVSTLGAGSKRRVRVPLVGAAPSADLHVEAIPTILQ